jgi:curved DNA-binding protein CbpA
MSNASIDFLNIESYEDSRVNTTIEIDFSNLKYNLYEILNVSETANLKEIKKNFIKLVKNFHPDKNSKLEEDIYYHIMLANQILLNENYRKKYDNYINNYHNNFVDLKNNFKKNITKNFNNQSIDIKTFSQTVYELNKKHGYDENLNFEKINEKFNLIKSNRNNNDIIIERNIFKSNDEFNDIFKNNKLNNGKFSHQIIEYSGRPDALSTYIFNEPYSNIYDIDKLYIDDSIQSPLFSSLDKAFVLHPELEISDSTSIENKIKNYKNQKFIIKL